MIPPNSVKAQVVDICITRAALPKSVVADANIIYFTYGNFAALESAGGTLPRRYQTHDYPGWWKRAISGGVIIATAASCLAELAHIYERLELEILWGTDPARPELDPRDPGQAFSAKYAKTVRYLYANQLEMVRSEVETALQAVRKEVELLPQVGNNADAFAAAVKEWLPSICDFGDAVLVAAAKRAGIPRIISDDADLITSEGITVYTANRNAIQAASIAGKLVS